MAYKLLVQPFGQLLTGIFALIIVGIGIGQIYIALSEKFLKRLNLPSDKKRPLCLISKFGLISRGIVFAIVGWLFMRAALHADSSEAKGVKGAWVFLFDQPFGRGLVFTIAVGLIAFAVYGVTEARYKEIS